MRRLRSFVVLSLTGVLLAGCATSAGAQGAGQRSTAPTPSATPTPTGPADPDAAAKADSWLEGAVLPPGAVRSETIASSNAPLSNSYYAWPCSPMEKRTGYWTVDLISVTEAANWMNEHPTADLMVAAPVTWPDDASIDSVGLGNVPERFALEGIAFTIARAGNGVAIRAEIGAFTKDTVCPTPPGGGMWGGPGQG